MHRPVVGRPAREIVLTASESRCDACASPLHVTQHRDRYVQRLDGLIHLVRRDKRCPDRECSGRSSIFRPFEDLRLALPRMSFGTDVVVAVGEQHLAQGLSLRAIGRDLTAQGVLIHQTHVGQILRYYLALAKFARGDDEALKGRLRAQGGIVAMFDGVQFDDRSPVLYLAWDAVSGAPLFGERKEFRSADDLLPLIERVKAMDVPIIGVVTDKEKGLVPAVARAFPGARHQFCQTHFLKNCAKPIDPDRRALGESVRRRADRVRDIAKRLHTVKPSEPASKARSSTNAAESGGSIAEADLVEELCSIVRQNARAAGKAPLAPPELGRHERLEAVREAVEKAIEKKGVRKHRRARRSSNSSPS